MEEKKSKKERIIIGISVICIMLVIVGIMIIKNNKKTEIISSLEDTANVVEGTTLFEDIGHYGVAIAGNNNADKGTSRGVNVKLITNYPSNWDEIKKNIPSDILSKINNMSGSRLDFDGTVKKAWINLMLHGVSSCDILIIKPDGSYELLQFDSMIPIEIFESGWYYVSLLGVPAHPQQSWAITTRGGRECNYGSHNNIKLQ